MSFVQNIKDIKRLGQIIRILFKHEIGYFIEKLRLKDYLTLDERLRKEEFSKRNAQPKRMRLVLEELGGAFIKLGQLLSLRPDLIPEEYCQEFSKLQDRVKAFPYGIVKEIIEEELKQPIDKLFKEFNKEPIAAASIGQVHDATLNNGKKVVVKVQRPDIEKIFATDIDILYHLARRFEEKYGKEIIDAVEIVDEFKRYTEDELNYIKEGKNSDKVYINFMHDSKVKIPKVFWDYTTRRILTLESIKGKRLSEIKNKIDNRKKIVENITNAVFKQIFIDGVFHADPHPGNILVMEKSNVAFLDFGIVGDIDNELREKIADLFVAVIEGDVDNTGIAIANLKISDEDIDIDVLKRDIRESLGDYFNIPLAKVDIGDIFHRLIRLAKKDNIKLPREFILLGKCVITLESLASSIDPDFNIVVVGKPFAKRIIKMKATPREIFARLKKNTMYLREFITHFPTKTNLFLKRVRDADIILKMIDKEIVNLTIEMNRSSNRVTISFILTGLIIAGALMMPYNEVTIYGISALSFAAFAIAILLALILVISIAREKK